MHTSSPSCVKRHDSGENRGLRMCLQSSLTGVVRKDPPKHISGMNIVGLVS